MIDSAVPQESPAIYSLLSRSEMGADHSAGPMTSLASVLYIAERITCLFLFLML